MIKKDQVYLEYIVEAITKIEGFTKGMSRDHFVHNVMMQDAIIRNIEIIGEATKKISSEFTISHHKIPWADMAGMRNKLIHDYMDVDLDVVWKTVEVDLPLLKELLSNI